MSSADCRVESSGWTKVRAGCPVDVMVTGDDIQFEFGDRSELFLIFTEDSLREFVDIAARALREAAAEPLPA